MDYFAGKLHDYAYPEEEIAMALSGLPVVPAPDRPSRATGLRKKRAIEGTTPIEVLFPGQRLPDGMGRAPDTRPRGEWVWPRLSVILVARGHPQPRRQTTSFNPRAQAGRRGHNTRRQTCGSVLILACGCGLNEIACGCGLNERSGDTTQEE